LSDNFLPVDDPLREAYLDSLKEIDSEQVKSELGQSEELTKVVNNMNVLLGQLTLQKCENDFEVVEKTENNVVSNDDDGNIA